MGHPASLLCGSVWGQVLERGQCHCQASGGLPGTGPISSHFIHFWNMTGALPAAVLVIKPRVGGFAYVLSPYRPFKWQISCSFFLCPHSHWFLQREVTGIYLPGARTLGCVIWPGTGIARLPDIPPNFYPPQGQSVTLLPPLLLSPRLYLSYLS